MTRLMTLILSVLRRRPAQPPAPLPARVIPIYIGGKPYTLEIYE